MSDRSLQIEEDLQYQERAWKTQRAAWLLMLVGILAAAAGAFGKGLLSSASVGQKEELTVEYERFLRYLSPTSLTFRITPVKSEQRELHIRINSDYLHAMKVEKVVPEAIRVEAGDKWLTYTFAVNTPGEVMVKFDLTAEEIGWLSARISGEGASDVAFRQFVYP